MQFDGERDLNSTVTIFSLIKAGDFRQAVDFSMVVIIVKNIYCLSVGEAVEMNFAIHDFFKQESFGCCAGFCI